LTSFVEVRIPVCEVTRLCQQFSFEDQREPEPRP
jgi:hypothetical protein